MSRVSKPFEIPVSFVSGSARRCLNELSIKNCRECEQTFKEACVCTWVGLIIHIYSIWKKRLKLNFLEERVVVFVWKWATCQRHDLISMRVGRNTSSDIDQTFPKELKTESDAIWKNQVKLMRGKTNEPGGAVADATMHALLQESRWSIQGEATRTFSIRQIFSERMIHSFQLI